MPYYRTDRNARPRSLRFIRTNYGFVIKLWKFQFAVVWAD